MLVCLVLGMGIPTIPNYIITSSIAAPALLKLGVPLIVSHMFVFYFGIMADLTPPVALAAFAASSIAKESGLKIGLKAVQIAIAGFVIPYMAVYSPALMLQGDWTIAAVAYIVFKAVLSIGLWGAAAIGFLFAPLKWPERIFAAAAAFMLVAAIPLTDEIGFAMSARGQCLHPELDPFHRENPLGRRLAHRGRRAGDRRGAHPRQRRRHGAADRGSTQGRRLALPAGTAAAGRVAPGAFAACRRLHAVHRDGLRPACRLPAGDRQ
jgi:hypothetical protein